MSKKENLTETVREPRIGSGHPNLPRPNIKPVVKPTPTPVPKTKK